MSINLEDVPYPHPVVYHAFNLEGQDVRMAYMDVATRGPANGKSVVLLHGMNFFGEAWAETIEILRGEGYRVIVPDQIGYGRSSKPILHYSISTHGQHQRCSTSSASRRPIRDALDGGMVASRYARIPSRGQSGHDQQIGLTDARAASWRYVRGLQGRARRDYAEIVGMRAYYVNWKRIMEMREIHYGWIKSGDWPRMAIVRALQRQAIYADPWSLAADQGARSSSAEKDVETRGQARGRHDYAGISS
jgi:pimeloyl-ACP methyl ester carboxylesterase